MSPFSLETNSMGAPRNRNVVADCGINCAVPIDGTVIIHEADGIKPGDMVSVTVTDSDEYDLFGVPAAVAENLDAQAKASA